MGREGKGREGKGREGKKLRGLELGDDVLITYKAINTYASQRYLQAA